MSSLRLIFNADDLGRTPSINDAVMKAYRNGPLTSASLMVTGSAAGDAVARVRECPGLAVGLHLTLAGGQGALGQQQARHLLDSLGRLPANPAAVGVSCFFNPAVRAELHREIRAQFELFADTGLTPSHIDGHYLLHLHPTVFAVLVPLAEEYGFRGIRLARDDLRLTLRLDRRDLAAKVGWASTYALLCHLAERRLRRSTLAVTDRVYGHLQSGRMHEGFVVGLLHRIPAGVRSAELYFHPSTEDGNEPYGPNSGDLAALLSPRVRRVIDERRAWLTNYAALAARRHGRIPCPGQ
jgi:hopanoid biosynthesis associated protein HpnK